jgi:hypothetical protein
MEVTLQTACVAVRTKKQNKTSWSEAAWPSSAKVKLYDVQ